MNTMNIDMHEEASLNKRTPKLRRSCETCRGSKGRCLPSDSDPNQCQRCLKESKPCVFLEAKPRPKRAKNSRLRVADMEEKLEGLLNLLATQTGVNGPGIPTSSTSPSSSTTPPSTRDQIDVDLPLFPSAAPTPTMFPPSYPMHSARSPENLNSSGQYIISSITTNNHNFDRIQDVFSKGIVDLNQAEQAFRLFQASCTSFPFVVVPEGMSLDAMRRHRPFLLLSILTFATAANEKLQERLERELRESLGRRMIVDGEKSLDLLEGLLVYVAWYHYYFNPENEQLYQLCQMATSLAADLGISRPPLPSTTMTKFNYARPTTFMADITFEEAEAKRVFLGCYYLSSSICHGLRKPNNMKYSSYMEECAQSLAQAGHIKTDSLISYFIQLQRLSEEVSDTFDYAATFELPALDAIRVGVLAKNFEQQLNQIESSFSQEAWNSVQLTMGLHFTRIHLNEVGFHATPLPEEASLSYQLKSRSWYYSSARSESLIRCLQACKDYLDRFLSLPPEMVMTGTSVDILSLVYTVLVLGTFAVKVDTPNLDSAQLREMANYDHYLNALLAKTTHIAAMMGSAGANGYLHHVHVMFQQTKVWYAQILADPSMDGFPVMRAGCPFTDLIGTIVSRCVDFDHVASLSLTTSTTNTSDEQWTELLSEWSGSLEPVTISIEGSNKQF